MSYRGRVVQRSLYGINTEKFQSERMSLVGFEFNLIPILILRGNLYLQIGIIIYFMFSIKKD